MNSFTGFTGFTLDPVAAKRADGGQFITQSGQYKGQFIKAQAIKSHKGATGIEFEFESENGERARLNIYTHGGDGSAIVGFGKLQALLTCLQLREIAAPVPITANVWDANEQKRVDKPVPQYAELLGKPIGVLIEMEEYVNGSNETKKRANAAHFFCAKTGRMASEILERKETPERLEKLTAALKDKKTRQARPIQTRSPVLPLRPRKTCLMTTCLFSRRYLVTPFYGLPSF